MQPLPKLILVVDDQDDERTIQRTMLGHVGYRVVEASDGEAALRLAQTEPPDLVLLDLAMPRMDGLQTCRALRADARTRAVPVLLLTARTSDDLRVELSEAGAAGMLVKPVHPREIAALVRELVGPP